MIEQIIEGVFLSNPWVIPLLVLGLFLKFFAPMLKGKMGEGIVNLAAKLRLDSNTYELLKDVTIPTRDGKTSQIDHVILSVYGIFVVETKNYKGWIFGTAQDRQWTQVNFKKKNRFMNPIRQNYGHICALSELLDIPKSRFHNVVCFMGDAKFKTEVPEGVFIHGSYVTHIKSFKTEVFTQQELNAMRSKIESGRLQRGFKTNRQHVKNLKAKPKADPSVALTCCRCGSPMVLRTANKGANAGNQFWGCSAFPKCRNTKPA